MEKHPAMLITRGNADGALVLEISWRDAEGVACAPPGSVLHQLPDMLREVADHIEAQMRASTVH